MAGDAKPTPTRLLQGLSALALLVVAVIVLRRVGGDDAAHAGPIFSLGFLVIGGAVMGSVAAFVGLPKLTGYLVAGVLSGPSGFGILEYSDVKALSLINVLALALISLQAGAELTVALLARTWRSVLSSAFSQTVLVVLPMAGLFFALSGFMPFLDGLGTGPRLAVGLIWGVLALTRSPAVTLAILSETKAKGPLSEHSLGVAVLIATGQLAGADFEIDVFFRLGRELFASVCAGTSFGLFIAVLLRIIVQDRILMLVVLGYGVTALTTYLRYDTMLVFRIAGFVVMNLTRFGKDVIHVSERLGSGVMIVFFATAGAKLDLNALKTLWPIALAVFVGRIVFTYVSVQVGHRLVKDPPPVRKYAWTSLVSQAGVTIGLATIIADALPGVGKALATLVIAVVGLCELAGPVVFTWGLKKAREIPKTDDHHKGEQHDDVTAPPTPTSA